MPQSPHSADVLVVGLGVNGASAAWRIAGRGASVVAFDRFAPPHPFGSSHGRSRIIREAYFEGEAYVPLVRRAFDGWLALEDETGRPLHRRTGGLTLAPEGGGIVAAARDAMARHGTALELLDAGELRRRFPDFRVEDDDAGVWEPGAAVLYADRCVDALIEAAARAGADVHRGESVLAWRAEGDGVRVQTTRGAYTAGRLVLAAGPWQRDLLAARRVPLEIERSVLHWFEPARRDLDAERLPVFIEELEAGILWYGIPEPGALKVAFHHGGQRAGGGDRPAIDALRRDVDPAEVDAVRSLLETLIPGAAGAHRGSRVCPYTNTPDEHFLLDLHPDHPEVVLASACSGHGFKFGPAAGEIVADLALTGERDAVPARFHWRW